MPETGATQVKFTRLLVEEVAARAKKITGGRFALGVVGVHPEYGTSYADAHEQITWYGTKGARQACAYYSGAALRMARIEGFQMDPADSDFFLGVQVAYGRRGGSSRADRGSFDEWEADTTCGNGSEVPT